MTTSRFTKTGSINNISFINRHFGYSLIELLLVISIIAIITGSITLTFHSTIDNCRLRSTAHDIYSHLQFARHEALRSGKPISISFNQNSQNWCYGFGDDQTAGNCNCLESQSCTVDGIEKRYFYSNNNINLAQASFSGSDDTLIFSPENGTARNGSIWLRSVKEEMMAVVISRLGRIRICKAEESSCPTPPESTNL
ncbi:MAG: GspH/FimT family pseudopilin [Gammaproteobacteria bacterium]|nr:GspH/FimT family pseudopilin [Gammaproteobacteria bacterium]